MYGQEIAVLGVLYLAVLFVRLGQGLKDFLKILRSKWVLLYPGCELGPVVQDGVGTEQQATDSLKNVIIRSDGVRLLSGC